MGVTNSKGENSQAMKLCKERKRFIKQAIDSRYALAAAHVSYVESLKNIGIVLRKYAETEILIEPSISTAATEVDKTPTHSSYPSPSLSHIAGVSDSPILNGSPLSPPTARMSYMMAGGSSTLTVRVSPVPARNMFMDDADCSTPLPPPPPPEYGSSWDYFDPLEDAESFRFVGQDNMQPHFDDGKAFGKPGEKSGDNEIDEVFVTPKSECRSNSKLIVHDGNSAMQQKYESNGQSVVDGRVKEGSAQKGNSSAGKSVGKVGLESSISKKDMSLVEKDVCGEREDPSEFITHRAKDFLSSIKDIEHRFFRASESGREVSRMLEANKIRVGYDQAKGKSPASAYLDSFRKVCCRGKNANVTYDPEHEVTKVITWKRTTSSRSSSSRNPLTAASKDENDDSGSDFMEEFCMIAGSNSSTLDRLYAWERKLYDEVKASETIRREYDLKCTQLRHQFTKDISTQVIDKTRAVVKDLHTRIIVALHSVDSISKRIEKMRDEELLPQLLEFLQGLIRMWKVMLECHHAQYITISLAYHTKSLARIHQSGSQNESLLQLQDELECFGLSFANWINSLTSYVESLNSWLQICILLPQERSKSRRAFSPRRVLAPPIFALCRDWSVGIKSLPSEELSDAIRCFLHDIRCSYGRVDEPQKEETTTDSHEGKELEPDNGDKTDYRSLNLSSLQSSLTKVFDRLTKFSEASLKMSEDVKLKCETARNAYLTYKPPARSFTI